jgi:hypothetical protein
MTPAEEYLLDYLKDEFRRFSEIRVDVRKEDGEWGIIVRSESRQWFFPYEWASAQGFKKVHALAAQIRELMEDRGRSV